jgi:hypothetical protein
MSSYGEERGSYGKEGGDESHFPNKSDPGKCVLHEGPQGKIGCEKLSGCQAECMLFSVPRDNPNVPQTEWVTEGIYPPGGFTPDPNRYYFCRCVEL